LKREKTNLTSLNPESYTRTCTLNTVQVHLSQSNLILCMVKKATYSRELSQQSFGRFVYMSPAALYSRCTTACLIAWVHRCQANSGNVVHHHQCQPPVGRKRVSSPYHPVCDSVCLEGGGAFPHVRQAACRSDQLLALKLSSMTRQ